MSSAADSSSEDDSYVNAAARLKVLKATRPIRKKEKRTAPVQKIIEKPISPIARPTTVINQPVQPDLIERGRLRSSVITRSSVDQIPRAPIDLDSSTNAEIRNTEHLIPSAIIDLDSSLFDTPSSIPGNNIGASNAVVIDDSVDIDDDFDTDLADITDDGCTIEVKVRWRSRDVERFALGKNEKLAKIFEFFASLENVPENRILLTRNEISVNQHDTPASINLRIIDVLEGGIIDTVYAGQHENSEEVCKIKIQSSSSIRNCLTYDLGRSEEFEKLIEWYAKEKNVSSNKIKCFFDGELVSLSDTPDSLDLDDEACVDIQIASS